ncbi:Hypothetical predicted protein [Octopus vulgaris]|uniref:Rhodanese domain-containing protein n=1 Tax=Octopus vulgaris TaxID=6645 RepID=A0AA36BP43_OCTVU|nr:Hypothetical predicted protein [Octopus vulgaris]
MSTLQLRLVPFLARTLKLQNGCRMSAVYRLPQHKYKAKTTSFSPNYRKFNSIANNNNIYRQNSATASLLLVSTQVGQIKEALLMADDLFLNTYGVVKPSLQDTNIVFVGLGPIKSSAALEIAHKAGFKKARHYYGGYKEWLTKTQTTESPPA